MRFHYFVVGLAAAGLAVPASADNKQDIANRVDSIAARFSSTPITGMTIAVSRNGKLVHIRGYGLADVATGKASASDTVYEIGSITKEFTAAATMRLAEQKRLSLEDEIGQHFPNLGKVAEGVKVRHLLNHTSGLFSGKHVDDLTRETDPAGVVELLASSEREFEPGSRFRYNNNGYLLLGLLIEKLSGTSWPEHMEQEFFAPLGLNSTSVCEPDRNAATTATGYRHPTRGPAVPEQFERHHPTVSYSAGAICSTAGDLLRWQDALVNGRVVSATSFDAMKSPAALQSGKLSPYGLGLFTDEALGEPHFHHGGASSGFITQLGYFAKDNTGIVVLTNGIYSGAIVEQLERAVLRAARGHDDEGPARLPMTATERQPYVGTYDLGPLKVEVYVQGEDLRAQPGDQIAARLLHQGGGRFIAEHDPSIEMHFRSDGGTVNELILSKNGRAMPPGKRVQLK